MEQYFTYLTERYNAVFLRTSPEVLLAEDSYIAYIFRYNTILVKKKIINYNELSDYLSRADIEELTRWIEEAKYSDYIMHAPYFETYEDIYCEIESSGSVRLYARPGEYHSVVPLLPDSMRISEMGTDGGEWVFVGGTWKEKEYFG